MLLQAWYSYLIEVKIPSKDLIVVRTGLKENPAFDVNDFLKEIIESIE